jgi:DNA-binding CsgD family transcriptional regulator/tetratricopeptide (TPR) repeat protein
MLLGRDPEIESLASAAADPGRPTVLYGEAGVGKTSLIRAAVQASGRVGYEAGCLATLSWMPYLPLHRAFGGSTEPGRPARWPALAELNAGDPAFVVDEIDAAVGSDVLVLDDVQWADAATRTLIPLLVGRVRTLAAVRRADPGAQDALALLRAAGFDVVELDPLPEAYAGALARRVRPDLGPAAVADVVRRSGGNPLLVEELAGTGVAGASLRLALTARMRHLTPQCRDAVALLALAERPLPTAVLGASTQQLWDTGLVRGSDTVVELRHGLLAELAVDMLEPEHRAALHERLAGIVEEPGQAARHLLAAGLRDRARQAAMRAADAATSPGERAQHLGLAASCLDGPDAADLRLDAAEQLAQVGQFLLAEPLVQDVQSDDPIRTARASAIRLRIAYEEMDRDTCRAALATGLAAANGSGHPIEVRLACEEAFVALMVDFDLDRAASLARRAVEMADERGEHRARARYVLGTAGYFLGDPEWPSNLATAVELARAEGEIAVECAAGNNLITANESSGSPERAREIADEMIERALELHLTEWRQQYEAMRLNLAWHAGDYAAVLSDGSRLLAEPLRPITRRQVQMTICLTLVDLGRIDDAFATIETILAEQVEDDTFQESVHLHRAEALLWDGRPGRALAEWPAHRDATTHMNDLLAFGAATFAWAALLAGEPIPEFGEMNPTTKVCQAGPVEVAAVRALQADRWADAVALFEEAAARWQPYNVRNAVRSKWGAGEALRRAGRTDEAVTRLLEAERMATEHEMIPLLGQIRSSLRAAGVSRSAARVAGRRAEAGGATGVAGLSGREREVLTLVGQGLSDTAIGARLGISPRTVESQLASARRKLGARTRHQAAAMLLGA